MAEQRLAELMEKMVQDRERREREVAEERERREEEIRVERARYEEERIARQKEAEVQMSFMKEQMERLMKVVEGSTGGAQSTAGTKLNVKLVPLTEKDDIEAYLVTFERIMEGQKIGKDSWSHYLAPQLTGRAQLAFAALPSTDASNYDTLKAAILTRYDINEEAYRRRFRAAGRRQGETNRELAVRMMDLQGKWLRSCQSMDEMQEATGIEQFLSTLPMDKKLWVMERKPKTCIQAGELVDEYEQARKETASEQRDQASKGRKCTYCGKTGHLEAACWTKPAEAGSTATLKSEQVRCFRCHRVGHLRKDCPEKGLFCGEAGQSGIYRKGVVEGKSVSDILLDTGCSRTMIRKDLVPASRYLEGDAVTIRCAHGDITLYPLADIRMEVDGLSIQVEAAVSDKLPAGVLLGTDVPALHTLLGTKPLPAKTHDVLVVTRAQARRQLEEELLRREKQVQPEAVQDIPQEVGEPGEGGSMTEEESIEQGLSRRQRRAMQQELYKPKVPEEGSPGTLDFSAEQLREMQQKDPSLKKIREAATGVPNSAGSGFFERDGLLYRKWVPPGRKEETGVEQLVLPVQCRQKILEISHAIPLAGHLGTTKTRQQIIRRFYWPSLFKDVDQFCKSCINCQKSGSRRVQKAPLIPLPIITEPFKRVAMDIVGPLPRSKSGHKYILVLCDYATRYPEAIPLRSIDAEHVAEELIQLFARVGIPQEILTDQGTNFMSQLLSELYKLLHIHSIRTSPYHPQTDGLVERFNQTLKSMLRKVVAKEGKDWDKMLPYLLFAYREVPQASTGFSPFELLYGRDVRGPLDVIRESWEASGEREDSVVSYVLSTLERLQEMAETVEENMSKAQARQKQWYDKGARLREFKKGDPVLVLLPSSSSRLLAQWQGPYQIIERTGKVTYRVDMHDKRKRHRVFHVNMLKEFQVRCPEQLVGIAEEVTGESFEEDLPLWDDGSDGKPAIGEQLTDAQRSEISSILATFQDVLQPRPGRTTLAEHHIRTKEDNPVKLPPYRLPHAYQEQVYQELQEMLDTGIIEKSTSEWGSPIVLVKKKDGTLRMCVDYRRLNAVSHMDAYPMPRIDDLIDKLGPAKFISTIDLTKGYWQVPVAAEDQHKTAFTTPMGLFQFRVMPFGLSGAPASFQRMADQLVDGIQNYAAAYLDDLVVFSSTWEDHLKQLQEILSRLRQAGLTAKPSKCQFGMRTCTYLGHVVGNGLIKPEVSKIQAVQSFAVPQSKRQVRAFLGLTGYYRRFIPGYAEIAAPLTDLTKKCAPNSVKWTNSCDTTFVTLKKLLCSPPVLRSPDFTKPFVLQTDASDIAVGAVLSQQDESGHDHPVAYFSRKLLPREVRYSTVEKECLAIRLATHAFRVYLLGREFVIETDHRSLEWLDRLKENNARLTRWSLALQPFSFLVVYRPGLKNGNADALSRAATN